jgi:hypothetical protein
MLLAVGGYTYAASYCVDQTVVNQNLTGEAAQAVSRFFTVTAMQVVACLVMLATFLISLRLPENTAKS